MKAVPRQNDFPDIALVKIQTEIVAKVFSEDNTSKIGMLFSKLNSEGLMVNSHKDHREHKVSQQPYRVGMATSMMSEGLSRGQQWQRLQNTNVTTILILPALRNFSSWMSQRCNLDSTSCKVGPERNSKSPSHIYTRPGIDMHFNNLYLDSILFFRCCWDLKPLLEVKQRWNICNEWKSHFLFPLTLQLVRWQTQNDSHWLRIERHT